tara:strand:- start:63 stop:368 length:306 start_codon:yes stop_codon:yes gene_type:complete
MRTLCQEAHELLMAREGAYGEMLASWKRISGAVSRRTGAYMSPETALWVLIEMKLERDRHSPENPDHLRDAIGYLGILGQVRAEQASVRSSDTQVLTLEQL